MLVLPLHRAGAADGRGVEEARLHGGLHHGVPTQVQVYHLVFESGEISLPLLIESNGYHMHLMIILIFTCYPNGI